MDNNLPNIVKFSSETFFRYVIEKIIKDGEINDGFFELVFFTHEDEELSVKDIEDGGHSKIKICLAEVEKSISEDAIKNVSDLDSFSKNHEVCIYLKTEILSSNSTGFSVIIFCREVAYKQVGIITSEGERYEIKATTARFSNKEEVVQESNYSRFESDEEYGDGEFENASENKSDSDERYKFKIDPSADSIVIKNNSKTFH